MLKRDFHSINLVVRSEAFEQDRLRALVLHELENHPQIITRAARPQAGKVALTYRL